MEDSHRDAIRQNYDILVNKVNLKELMPKLMEKGVFSIELSERYRNPNRSEKERKRDLFFDIQRRGPLAFVKLIECLEAIDYDHKKLAFKIQGKEVIEAELEVENNNYQPVAESERQKPSNVTNGAWPYMLPEEQRPPHIRQLSQEISNANINLSEQPLQVIVKKSDRWYDSKNLHKVPVYPMRAKQRGLFLCINNIEFNGLHGDRAGADIDETNLKELFKQIGFGIQVHRNQTKRDMQKTVVQFAESENLRTVDCIVVAIMSHGTEGSTKENTKIITSDGQYLSVSWLLEQFNNRNCPGLIYKPKIFLLQICRGDSPHVGVRVPVHPYSQPQNRIESDGGPQSYIVRDAEDMLIAFSTLPGDRSYRDIMLGTWYMQAICKVFMIHAYDTDIEHLLKMVDEELKQLRSEDGNMQTSSYENRGFKLCYLHPGIYQDGNNEMKQYNT